MQIILDISANTHQNEEKYYRTMIETISFRDLHRHEVIIKGQLFRKAGNNIPQDIALFERMANWTYETYGYMTTASVFDKLSLDLLLLMDIPYELPFIKIANNRELDYLIGEIPRKIPIFKSVSPELYWSGDLGEAAMTWAFEKIAHLLCVSKYPATATDYLKDKPGSLAHLKPYGLSDHTVGVDFVKEQEPQVYECHFVLEHDKKNLDGGLWAKTPHQLGEILE